MREDPRPATATSTSLDVGPVATEMSFKLLGRNKGVGRDQIPAEVLQAGEGAIAAKYAEINERVLENASWPTQWRGGKLINVLKKGDAEVCDNSRGILLADHVGKALTGTVKRTLDPQYNANQPDNQYAAPKKGTDIATHVVKSAIAASVMLEVSIFVLFVDLVKAFDKVIRQIVYGWGDGKPDDPKAFLESMGVTGSAASWICDYIDEKGRLMNQWGADEKANQLACTLHQGAWFSVGDLPSVITSETGGRQGCTLGMTTFNSAYTVGLDLLAWGLKKHDITMVVQVPTSAFWSEPDPANAERDDVIHATFVDDECIVLLVCSCF